MNLKTLNDKTLHFLAGAAVALVVGLLTGSVIWAVLLAILAGAAKEVYDSVTNGTVDAADFVFTALGGAAVAIALQVFGAG